MFHKAYELKCKKKGDKNMLFVVFYHKLIHIKVYLGVLKAYFAYK